MKITPVSSRSAGTSAHGGATDAPPKLVVSTARPLSRVGVPLWGFRCPGPTGGANGGNASWFSKGKAERWTGNSGG